MRVVDSLPPRDFWFTDKQIIGATAISIVAVGIFTGILVAAIAANILTLGGINVVLIPASLPFISNLIIAGAIGSVIGLGVLLTSIKIYEFFRKETKGVDQPDPAPNAKLSDEVKPDLNLNASTPQITERAKDLLNVVQELSLPFL